MANGKIVFNPPYEYQDGSGYLYVYDELPFDQNFAYGATQGFAPVPDPERALDGTLYSLRPYNKRRATLPFQFLDATQKGLIETVWMSGLAFDFYWDAADPGPLFRAYIMRPPEFKSAAAFRLGAHTWSVELEIEEV